MMSFGMEYMQEYRGYYTSHSCLSPFFNKMNYDIIIVLRFSSGTLLLCVNTESYLYKFFNRSAFVWEPAVKHYI